MTLQSRPYRELADLQKMKALIVEVRKVYPHSGYPHIGDLDWWLYYDSFIKDEPFENIVTLWEDGDQIRAWGIVQMPNAYDLVLHPALRDTSAEMQLHAQMETRIAALVKDADKPQGAFVYVDETARRESLEKRGYVGEDSLIYFTQPLNGDLPTPLLPEGFSFIDQMRPEWADRRADVHFNAFHPSRMTAQAYTHFMTAPDYDPTLDVVVAAPDGTFAAFAMVWLDPQTCIGSFEPVGTRNSMQRKGLGKAALLEGMRRMRGRGMTVATVLTYADSPGNIAFYESAGFKQANMIVKYEKKGS
ncbi:MAG: GNAT family N-acetyltransferase [Chloroflexota bacterium]